jgi:hypothetical protein
LTRNLGAEVNAGWQRAARARQTRISGGSIDNELNELAVKPHHAPAGSAVVTIVTPVANRAIASR